MSVDSFIRTFELPHCYHKVNRAVDMIHTIQEREDKGVSSPQKFVIYGVHFAKGDEIDYRTFTYNPKNPAELVLIGNVVGVFEGLLRSGAREERLYQALLKVSELQ